MPKQSKKQEPANLQPGPGRSTSEQAFNELRRDVAQRNERAHQEARRLRAVRERQQVMMRRGNDY
jgi:hypothetical protein